MNTIRISTEIIKQVIAVTGQATELLHTMIVDGTMPDEHEDRALEILQEAKRIIE